MLVERRAVTLLPNLGHDTANGSGAILVPAGTVGTSAGAILVPAGTVAISPRRQPWGHNRYIGGIIREKDGTLLEIGGIEDHVHIMAGFPATLSISDMLRFIKSNSSGWVNQTNKPKEKFGWQPGYGAFTVSHSQKPAVRRYIQTQEQHHQRRSFQDEFIQMLVNHGIEYDPRFVFEQEHHG